jgi:signal transduction histidine kinase/CheY-like chemotaxis protein/PAS domain-containing protein
MSINQPATIMIFAAIISLLLSVYAWQKRQNSTGVFLSLLLLSTTIWSLLYSFEIFSTDLETMKVFLLISYFGIASLPVFWLLFAARYSGGGLWLNPFVIIMLFIIPILSIVMIATNKFHLLFYKAIESGNIDSFHYLKLTPGPLWWTNIAYSHILIITGAILLIRHYFKVQKSQRIHIQFFLFSALIPYAVNLLYLMNFRPYGFLDLTPVAFIFMGVIILLGVYKVKLFDINPVAIDLYFRNTSDAIFIRNNDGKIINSNPAAVQLFESISASNNLHSKDNEFIYDDILVDNHDVTVIKIQEKYYEKTNTKISNNSGKLIGVITQLRDITKARETQIEKNNLANLQNLLMRMASKYINLKIDEIEEGIMESLQEIGIYAEADRAYIFNYNWENNTCSNTYEWCSEGISKELHNLQNISLNLIPDWVESHKQGKTLVVPDVFLQSKESSLRIHLEKQGIKSLITIPLMKDGKCLGYIGFDFIKKYHVFKDYENTLLSVYADILTNLIGRVELENRLIKEKENANAANKAKTEFLANMSHEIRTPMNSILGFAEVMLNTTADNQQKKYLNTILESGRTLLSLINDILDLSKIEAGRLEIIAEPTDIKAMIKELEGLFFHKINEKGLELKVEISHDFPRAIIIDDLRIRQIILNLVGNAVKFTHRGFIKIEVNILNKTGNTINFEIKVIDTGIGIAGKNYNHLFNAFSQQSGQTSRTYGGTGLGLAITKRLVELMNGKINVTSKLGEGSCFTVSFYGVKTTEISVIKNEGFEWSNKKLSFKNAKILVVDDILHNRTLVITFLSRYKLNFIEAENGEEALHKALTEHPDLIFMDIRMPKLDGYETTKMLKNNPQTAGVPIIALTASTMQDEMDKQSYLFDGYIRKPVQKKMLLEELVKFLPHEEEEFTESITNKFSIPAIDDSSVKISKKIKSQFIEEFGSQVQAHNDSIIIDEVSELADKLKGFGQNHGLNKLIGLAEELKINIDEFDFENINRSMERIRQMFTN